MCVGGGWGAVVRPLFIICGDRFDLLIYDRLYRIGWAIIMH